VSRTLAVAVLVVCLLGAAGVVGATTGQAAAGGSNTPLQSSPVPQATVTGSTTGADAPGIVAAYPDPVTDGDRGEFVLLALPAGANHSAWTLSDDGATVPLGDGSGGGRVAVADDPHLAREHTDATVLNVSLSLSNAGETLVLRRSGTVVDRVVYDDARESELYVHGRWRPLGATNHSVTDRPVDEVRTFLLPDSPEVPADVLASAEERILLAGYTFESERVTRRLIDAAERGVSVSVLLEASPVGGRSRRSARLLDRLDAAGVRVRVLGGPRARYDYHHAKYAVVDDRALVLTENWKPSGVGGRANRGWGVVVPDAAVANDLARVFHADADNVDALAWADYRAGRQFTAADDSPANGTFETTTPARRIDADSVELLVAPDNAEARLVGLIDGAEERILVQQMAVGGPDGPFLSATLAAARRGVEVRVLLSGAWYVREKNRRLVEHLRAVADAEDLPLSAKLTDPNGRYRKLHAKGVVVDDETAVVGSLNWNDHAPRENREVVVVVHGDAAAYYADAVRSDWETDDGGGEGTPVRLFALTAVVAVAGGVLVARRVAFADDGGADSGDVWRDPP